MDSLLLFFSLCFPVAAGHGLLDYVPTEAYWKDKHVAITGEAMLAQLQVEPTKVDATQLIRELGDPDFETREKATQALIIAGSAVATEIQQATLSDDPEVATRAKRISKLLQQSASESQARQLMAVRTLGELRFAAAEPQLKKLVADTSTRPVLARYAQRALDQIAQPDGKLPGIKRTHPTPKELLSDLELLPASANCVLQAALNEPLKMPLNPGVDFKPFFGKGIPTDHREPMYLAKLIALADKIGEVHIDAVTAGFTSPADGKRSYIACVVRGEWEVDALRTLLAGGGYRSSMQDGMEVHSYQDHCKVLLMSEQRIFVTFGDALDDLPIKSLLAGGSAPGLLRHNEELWIVAGKADRTKPIWGAMISSELFRGTPWLEPVKFLTLEADQRGPEFKLTINAFVSDPPKIDAALVEFEKMLDKAEPESGQIAAMFPCAKPIAELMESLKTERKVNVVTATMQTPNLAPLLALPLVLTHNEWLK